MEQEQINTNQPTSTLPPKEPHKKKRSMIKMILMGVLGLFVLVLAIGAVQYTQIQQSIPQESTFYLATHENSSVLFFRNTNMLVSGIASDPHLGDFVEYEKPFDMDHHDMKNMDFRMLKNVHKLFVYDHYATIDNLKLSADKKYLFFSFIGGEQDNINYIYQINLDNRGSLKVWEHQLGSGFAHILDAVPNQFIAFSLVKGENPPVAVIVKNMKSGQEKNIGVVGDVRINVANKTVEYKVIQKVQAPCEKKDPVCFPTDTYKMVDKPAGKVLTQPLP